MQRLYWVVLLVLTVLWQVAPASAGQRVLLGAAGASTGYATALGTSSTLKGLRATARKAGTVKVIVGLRVPFAPAGTLSTGEARLQATEIASASSALRSRFAAAIKRSPKSFRAYGSIPFVALEVTLGELDKLAADPKVITITENIILKANLTQSAALIRAPEAWSTGFTGEGQTIAIIDSGIDKTHPFLGGRVVSEACYTLGSCPGGVSVSTASGSGMPCKSPAGQYVDGCEHGTHVAGIAAGYLSASFSGIAPRAQLIAIQVFTVEYDSNYQRYTAGVYLSDLNAGLERVYELRNTYAIAAVNMSLGWTGLHASSTCDSFYPSTTAVIDQLKSEGITTVIASGNEGDTNGISFPACISNAVSVGAVSDSKWGACSISGNPPSPTAADKVACYSNTSSQLSLLAPGSPITSSVPGGLYATEHGTSMAAPHVAGAIALLRQKSNGMSADDILEKLKDTGVPVTDDRNTRITTPRIDVAAALDASANSDPTGIDLRVTGNGRGTVTLSPAGNLSSCSESCKVTYAPGTIVKLTASVQNGSSFAGWSGACSGMGSCEVTVKGMKTVFALFYTISNGPPQAFTISTSGAGDGLVSMVANGQVTTCRGTCTRSYGQNTMLKITAVPAYGAKLAGWSGACRGAKSTCVVRLRTPKSVDANFVPVPFMPLAYTRGGAGAGTVTIIVGGAKMNCSENCTNQFPQGTRITVTAVPAKNVSFSGWSGVCRGRKSTCTFTLKGQSSLSASFN